MASPARAEVIRILGEARRKVLDATPRGDSRRFSPCADNVARNKRYLARAAIEAANRAAIREGRKRRDGDAL